MIVVLNFDRTKYFKVELLTYIVTFLGAGPDGRSNRVSATEYALAATLDMLYEKRLIDLNEVRKIIGTWDRLHPIANIDYRVKATEVPMPQRGYFLYRADGTEVEE